MSEAICACIPSRAGPTSGPASTGFVSHGRSDIVNDHGQEFAKSFAGALRATGDHAPAADRQSWGRTSTYRRARESLTVWGRQRRSPCRRPRLGPCVTPTVRRSPVEENGNLVSPPERALQRGVQRYLVPRHDHEAPRRPSIRSVACSIPSVHLTSDFLLATGGWGVVRESTALLCLTREALSGMKGKCRAWHTRAVGCESVFANGGRGLRRNTRGAAPPGPSRALARSVSSSDDTAHEKHGPQPARFPPFLLTAQGR